MLVTQVPVTTNSVHNPAAATQATVTVAAAGAGFRNVCVGLIVSLACGATAQTPIHWFLRDGATGAGTIKASGVFSAIVNGSAYLALDELRIWGSENTGMTLEFEAAGVAASLQSVTLFSITEKM